MPEKSRAAAGAMLLALVAAALRLVPLQWLQPLQWDEVEYFRATRWVAQGLVPFRDFWEHHTPLQWFVFAPFAALVKSPGANAIVAMRWAQVPLWIATFGLAAIWMRDAGLSRFARWCATALALCSSFLMIAAVEYRVDTLGCALVMLGLVLVQRRSNAALFGAGVAFCAAGLANLRLGPLLAVAALIVLFRERLRALWLGAGVAALGAMAAGYFAATHSFAALYQHVWVENYLGDRYAAAVANGFLHRLLIPFGIRLLGAQGSFDLAGIDVGGALLLLAGTAGLVLALLRWRTRDELFFLALLQLANVVFIARMKFVYNYHFEIVVLLMLPLIALTIERLPQRGVFAAVVAAVLVAAFASLLRGKELDRAYQDLVMREVDARTQPGDRVFDGVGWALHREPYYRFWFLPDLTRQLVSHGHAKAIDVNAFVHDPPAAVITDHNVLVWLQFQPELQRVIVRHYLPVWRNLWMPALSARLDATTRSASWMAPADGDYRVYASHALAAHPWFGRPLFVASYYEADAARLEMPLGAPFANAPLSWQIDGNPVSGSVLRLRKGQRVDVTTTSDEPIGIFAVPGNEARLFRQPPPGVTIDGSAPRVTHWPRL